PTLRPRGRSDRHRLDRKRCHQRRSAQYHPGWKSSEAFASYPTDCGGHKVSVSTNVPTTTPFLDQVTPHIELEQELTAIFQKALRTAGFIGGPLVEHFERVCAEFCDAKFAVGVSS